MYAGENLLYNVRNDFTQNSPTKKSYTIHGFKPKITSRCQQDSPLVCITVTSRTGAKNMGKWYEIETGQYPRQYQKYNIVDDDWIKGHCLLLF